MYKFENTLPKLPLGNRVKVNLHIVVHRLSNVHPHHVYNYFPTDQSNHKFLSEWARKYVPEISSMRISKRGKELVSKFIEDARQSTILYNPTNKRFLSNKEMHVLNEKN